MGLTSSIPQEFIAKSRQAFESQPNFYYLPKSNDRYLSSFRGKLRGQECGYVLAVLMHRYLPAIGNQIEVVISDDLCKVTSQGQVFISSWTEANLDLQPVNNYAIATSTILTLIEGLWQENLILWQGQLGSLKSQLLEVMFSLGESQQLMYKKLLKLVEQYLKAAKITCNLKAALLREQIAKSNTIRRKGSQIYRHISTPFAREKIDFCESEVSFSTNSFKDNKKAKKSNLSLTAQYSLNLKPNVSSQSNRRLGTNNKLSCIRKRYATAMLRQSCHTEAPSTPQSEIHRNNTAINLNSSNRSSIPRRSSRIKTVLDTMARLVEVREEPSSKSIIC